MRYLVFLRGVPGSGKSTFVRENNLEPYTISSDNVRLLLKPPILSVTGKPALLNKFNPRVWGLIHSLINPVWRTGISQFSNDKCIKQDIAKYRKLVRTYRYTALCVDFRISS